MRGTFPASRVGPPHGTLGRGGPGGLDRVRHAETIDCYVARVTGTLARPDAVLVQLPDGRQEVTSPRLTTAQARQVAAAVAGRLRPARAGQARVRMVREPLPVAEVRIGNRSAWRCAVRPAPA